MGKANFLGKKGGDDRLIFPRLIHGNISGDDREGELFSLERYHDHDDDGFFKKQGLKGVDDFVNDDQPQYAAEERRIYWESQEFLLQEILDQYNSTGSKLREQIARHIDTARESNFCNCLDKNKNHLMRLRGGCIKCLRRAAVNQLCSKGFSAALCVSKWKRTHKTPAGGTHEYIEVIAITQGSKKQIPFLVELGFLDEFRMAKSCDEYNKLINQLPEMYIGKYEHLNAIIRVVCEAAKKSAEEQKIHMGPWRKRSFMQMKWSASSTHHDHRSLNLDHSQNELWINSSSNQERAVNPAAGTSFQIAMAATVKVA